MGSISYTDDSRCTRVGVFPLLDVFVLAHFVCNRTSACAYSSAYQRPFATSGESTDHCASNC